MLLNHLLDGVWYWYFQAWLLQQIQIQPRNSLVHTLKIWSVHTAACQNNSWKPSFTEPKTQTCCDSVQPKPFTETHATSSSNPTHYTTDPNAAERERLKWGKTLQLKTSEPLAHLHVPATVCIAWRYGIWQPPADRRESQTLWKLNHSQRNIWCFWLLNQTSFRDKRLHNDRRQSNPQELTETVCFAPNRSTTD